MRLQLALAVLAAAGSLVVPRVAAACSCPGRDDSSEAIASAIEFADVVFEGQAIAAAQGVAVELLSDGYVGGLRHSFEVTRYFKGRLGADLPIFTPPDGGACGRQYPVGETYLVYARYQDDGLLMDSLCSRSRSLEHASLDLELLGDGVSPDVAVTGPDVVAANPDVPATRPDVAAAAGPDVTTASPDPSPRIEGGCGVTRGHPSRAAALSLGLLAAAALLSRRPRRV